MRGALQIPFKPDRSGGFDVFKPDRSSSRKDLDNDLKGLKKLIENDGQALTEKEKKKIATFSKEFRKLKKKVGAASDDFKSDAHTRAMYRAMMAMGLDLIPLAQQKYMDTRSESAMYALNAMINQVKDLSSAMRGMQDLEQQAEHIVQRILLPAFVQASQSLMSFMIPMKAEIDSLNLPSRESNKLKASLDNILRQQAVYLQELSKGVHENSKKYLLGES